jgi:hypothetical protein
MIVIVMVMVAPVSKGERKEKRAELGWSALSK